MKYLRIRNWAKHQTIVGKNAPYVTLKTSILLDMEFMSLSDRDRLCFILLIAFAGVSQNKIPCDACHIMHLCHFDDPPNIDLLVEKGFLEDWKESDHAQAIDLYEQKRRGQRERKQKSRDKLKGHSHVTAMSQPSHALETETETDTETDKTHTSNLRFDEWWKAYPKKIERKKAFAIWKRRKLDSIADRIIEDTKNRPVLCAKWKAGYICNPTTYLNGDRWNDDYESPRTNGTGKDAVLTKHQERERRNSEAIERANRGEGITPQGYHGGHVATHD